METADGIIWLESVDSTSDELRRRIPGLDNLAVISAVEQTSGRGQRGNKWLTKAGENITLSMYVRPGEDGIPALRASDAFRLTACAALSVAEYVASRSVRCSIKWPNDIYCGDRKISGMLIESTVSEGHIKDAIIGIGVNVNQCDFPPEILNPTSLKKLTGQSFNIKEESAALVSLLKENLRMMDSPSLLQEYESRLYRKDGWHSFTDCSSGLTFDARIDGITADGKLRLVDRNGVIRCFFFKEVSYVI